MERIETVEFTNMCMICDGSRVVVMERKSRDWPGVTFPRRSCRAGRILYRCRDSGGAGEKPD